MLLPLNNVSDSHLANLFIKVYARWHKYSNLYSTTHSVPEIFNNRHYPVFSVQDSAETINNDPAKIKFFFNMSEGVRRFSAEHMPTLFKLKSDCVYIFVTGDKFSADDHPIFNWLGEKIHYVNIYWPFLLYQLATVDFFDPVFNFPNQNNDKFYDFRSEKTVDFVSLIGSGRPERTYLVKKIKNKIPEDSFALSICNNLRGNVTIFKHDIQFERTPDFNWSDRQQLQDTIAISESPPIDLYNQARLYLVVETQIADDQVDNFAITEKTTKALFTGIPFVIYGAKHFITNLRKMGFMTYESLWSEDYDSLPTYQERADAIVELMQHLSEFDWESVIPELERIHYHNLKLLVNRNKILHNAFLNFDQQLQEVIHQIESS